MGKPHIVRRKPLRGLDFDAHPVAEPDLFDRIEKGQRSVQRV
jgi:hypothetical protein